MADRPELALVHDGDLDDVGALLEGLGADFSVWSKSRSSGPPPDPSRLLVIRSDFAVSLRYRRTPGSGPRAPIWIAVADHDSRSLRTFLTQAGFNYVVRRPVHPAALRMLLRKALWAGKEARRNGRVPVGADVSCRVGLRRLRGTLVDLSPTGCRLLLSESPAEGAVFHVQLPGDLAGGSRFAVAGKVVRVGGADAEGGGEGEHAVALRFEPVVAAARDNLVRLLTTLSTGPATRAAQGGGHPGKRGPRGFYSEAVHALDEGSGPLTARDLSRGGIRIEAGPSLAVGQQLRLAIEMGGRSEPVIVTARVSRDDGRRGLALRFESIEGDGERRLEQLVSRLPQLAPSAAPAGPQQILSALGARLLRFGK